MQPNDQEFCKFQKEVREQYYALKAIRQGTDLRGFEQKLDWHKSVSGRIFIFIFRFVFRFMKRALDKDYKRRGFDLVENQANRLVFNSEIRRTICSAMQGRPKTEIITEDVFVEIFTAVLMSDAILARLDFQLDPVLFAMVGYEIYSTGLPSYCSQTTDET